MWIFGSIWKTQRGLSLNIENCDFPDSRIWGSLLAACRVHEDKTLGIYGTKAFRLEHDNIGYHTLLGNLQASFGQWNGVEEVRRVVNDKDLKKKPGWSCIEAKGMIHGFVSAVDHTIK